MQKYTPRLNYENFPGESADLLWQKKEGGLAPPLLGFYRESHRAVSAQVNLIQHIVAVILMDDELALVNLPSDALSVCLGERLPRHDLVGSPTPDNKSSHVYSD